MRWNNNIIVQSSVKHPPSYCGVTVTCMINNKLLHQVILETCSVNMRSDMPPGTDCPYPIRIFAEKQIVEYV